MRKSTRLVLLALLMTVGTALPVAAQDVSLGYQFQRLTHEGDSENYPAGAYFDVAVPLGGNEMLSVLGQFDWSRKSVGGKTANLEDFAGGVRWTRMASPKANVYIQGVAGGIHHTGGETGTNFTAGADGGVTTPIKGYYDALFQIGYRFIRDPGANLNSLHIVVGIRVHVKK